MADGSVTHWLRLLEAGQVSAAQPLWERYFAQLVPLCQRHLAGVRAAYGDGEDVAASVMGHFVQGSLRRKFPSLNDRDDLWKLLLTMAARHAISRRRKATRHKRGGNRVMDEQAMSPGDAEVGWTLDQALGDEPTPEMAAMVPDLLNKLATDLPDDRLRRIAVLKLEGYLNREIAEQLSCSERAVERKLELIRNWWRQSFLEPE